MDNIYCACYDRVQPGQPVYVYETPSGGFVASRQGFETNDYNGFEEIEGPWFVQELAQRRFRVWVEL